MYENIFQELQALADYENRNVVTSMEEERELLGDIVSFFKSLEWQQEATEWFAGIRSLKPETLFQADGFFYDSDLPDTDIPEDFRVDRLGLFKKGYSVYKGRFVYPVKDVRGKVAGFVGYDKFEEPKYLDSRNLGYLAKSTMLYGMEFLPFYYRIKKVFILEGAVDTLWLRENGLPVMSSLGSYLSPYVVEILKRFGKNCIVIPDADEAGDKFNRQVKRDLPQARVLQTKFANDVDEQRLLSDEMRERTLADFRNILTSPYCGLDTLMRT